MGLSRSFVLSLYISFRRRQSSVRNQGSERASSGGSTALSRYCIRRWVLVKLPSFSTCDAVEAGIDATSRRILTHREVALHFVILHDDKHGRSEWSSTTLGR